MREERRIRRRRRDSVLRFEDFSSGIMQRCCRLWPGQRIEQSESRGGEPCQHGDLETCEPRIDRRGNPAQAPNRQKVDEKLERVAIQEEHDVPRLESRSLERRYSRVEPLMEVAGRPAASTDWIDERADAGLEEHDPC